jgi:HD-like signal output (HDOD) protein
MTATQEAQQPYALLASDESFTFIRALAHELSAGKVALPGFPEIAARVQQVLSDENVRVERVVRVVGSEPVLSSQLLIVANSVAFNPAGNQISELRTAIARVGLNTVRTATIAYAVRQLRTADEVKPIAAELDALWKRTVLVSCLSYVLARRKTQVSPDTALLTGLLQGVGRLYILTRATRYPALFTNPAMYQAIERDWHVSIATALLENWCVSEEIVQAVRECEDYARDARGPVNLADIVMAATLIAVHGAQPDLLEARLQSVKAAARLELNSEICRQITEESAAEIAALRDALS